MKASPHSKGAPRLRGGVPFFVLAALFSAACSSAPQPPPASPDEALHQRGQAVYRTQCVACHSADPAKEGPVGPPVQGASAELLRARILSASYPPGYVPKRSTKAMPAMPHLEKDIDALAKFLSNP